MWKLIAALLALFKRVPVVSREVASRDTQAPLPVTRETQFGDDPALALASQMIRAFEGCARILSDGRIVPYLDAKRVPTIGWGNTQWEDGTPVTIADPAITSARAEALFLYHLRAFMHGVRAEIPDAHPHEAAAFCYFAYNVGIGGFRTSSALRFYRAGAINAAADALELWNKAGQVVVKGLQRRRRAEALVLKGTDWPQSKRLADLAFP